MKQIFEIKDKVIIDSVLNSAPQPGELVSRSRFKMKNAGVVAAGGTPATAQVALLGITRAALYTESWLSAASFEQTSSVLTDAASRGQRDDLIGLKENVIIGRLIPTSPERAALSQLGY